MIQASRPSCNSCEENVRFDLVDPLPREETKAPPSFKEIQARLKERSGALPLCSICCLTNQVRTLPFRREFRESFRWLTVLSSYSVLPSSVQGVTFDRVLECYQF